MVLLIKASGSDLIGVRHTHFPETASYFSAQSLSSVVSDQ